MTTYAPDHHLDTDPAISFGRAALLGIALNAELLMLVGLAWVGWALSPNLGVSMALAVWLPVCAAIVWSVWCSPKSMLRPATATRWAVKTALFAVTFVLLLGTAPAMSAVFGLGMWLLFLISLPADQPVATGEPQALGLTIRLVRAHD